MGTLTIPEKIQSLISLISFYKDQAKNATTEQLNSAIFMHTGQAKANISGYLATAFELEGLLSKVKDEFLAVANLTTVIKTATEEVKPQVTAPVVVEKVITPEVAEVAEMENVIKEVETTANMSLYNVTKDNAEERLNLYNLWQDKNKDAAYARYDVLLPENTHSKATKKQELARLASEVRAEQVQLEIKNTSEKVNDLQLSTASKIKTPFSGLELEERASKYTIDGNFNILVLTGSDDESDTPAEDLIRLKAKQLLSSGQEAIAVQHIQTLYAEKGMTKEMARAFLFKLIREDNNSELKLAIMALLSYGYVEKGDYHTMLSHCNSLVELYSRNQIGKDDKGNAIYKTWKPAKIQNFVDNCVNSLIERGVFPTTETKAIDTPAVETPVETITENSEVTVKVEETPLTNREKKAAKRREERAEKQIAKTETTKEVVETSAAKNTKESTSGPKMYDFVVNELHAIYTTEGHLNARALHLIDNNIKDRWFNPFNLFDLSVKAGLKATNKIISVLRDAKINPEDFKIVNEAGEICRVYRYNVYKNTAGNVWQNYAGQGIPTEEECVKMHNAITNIAIPLPETTESKNEQASAQAVISETSSQAPIVVDAGQSQSSEETVLQPKLVDTKDGVKTFLHPATEQFLANRKKEITAIIVETKKGFNAFIQGVKDFRVENAKTSEEAQAAIASQVIEFSNKATEHNDKVKSSGKGKFITLPTFLKDGFENISLVFKMKETAKAAV